MFGGRPPSRFRDKASFRRFQSGFYRLENASKTMEGIGRRAPKTFSAVYSIPARCLLGQLATYMYTQPTTSLEWMKVFDAAIMHGSGMLISSITAGDEATQNTTQNYHSHC
jgi:hypothetical protein